VSLVDSSPALASAPSLETIEKSETDPTDRTKLLLHVKSSSEVALFAQQLPSSFACLIAWHSTNVSVSEIAALASLLLTCGAVYVCTWGKDCERVHDIFDEDIVDENIRLGRDSVVMTTWHDDESLNDAMFFLQYCTNSADDLASPLANLAIVVDSAQWTDEIRAAFRDPGSL
jgi:hypothetical protein